MEVQRENDSPSSHSRLITKFIPKLFVLNLTSGFFPLHPVQSASLRAFSEASHNNSYLQVIVHPYLQWRLRNVVSVSKKERGNGLLGDNLYFLPQILLLKILDMTVFRSGRIRCSLRLLQ